MMFNLIIKSGEKKIVYKPYSLALKYLVDEKKLEQSLLNIEKIMNVKLSALQKRNFLAKDGKEIRASKKDGRPDDIIFSKVKADESLTTDYFRNHLAGFIGSIQSEEVSSLHIFIPKYDIFKKYFNDEKYYYRTFIEGIILGNYSFDLYKSGQKKKKNLEVFVYGENGKLIKSAIKTTLNLMNGVLFTKDLQNEPALNLTPDMLAKRVLTELTQAGIKVKIFDEKEIKRRKMGGLLAVGMGSDNPPKFIVIEYNGASKAGIKKPKKIALVGKGITFDSGGISIKPAANMGEMKADMSGAAVVAGTILAAAIEKIPVNIIGIIPTAENMPSGKSMRPGDIVKTSSGKTIEVDNTDAEGRIILGDALDFASKLNPAVIIDLATLTGACVVALGENTAGLFTKNDKLSAQCYKLGVKTYERVWAMPMWDDYNQLIKSDVADVKNVGGRWGGAISAAKFLEKFVNKDIPWAHIDIAGPAMANSFTNYSKKYMTGFGVRLLFEYLLGEI
ncbi:MAG: leucyl aminopeptidase [Ignavibacteriaceae bacterium]|nr:leucyl aminopeptidase [Ignavibacteriaceae bacterium]